MDLLKLIWISIKDNKAVAVVEAKIEISNSKKLMTKNHLKILPLKVKESKEFPSKRFERFWDFIIIALDNLPYNIVKIQNKSKRFSNS